MQKNYYSPQTNQKMMRKFASQEAVKGSASPRFPVSAEREYIRVMNSYMKEIKTVLEAELPTLKDAYRKEWEEQKLVRQDGLFDTDSFLDEFFDNILGKIGERLEKMNIFGKLIKKLRKIGKITKQTEVEEWKRMVNQTLGVDLSTDYYSGDFYEQEMERWVNENVDLIVTIPAEMLGRMKEIVKEGYQAGTATSEIVKQIQEAYGISKSHATLIARDQMAKLNADITRKEHEDAGITKYVWSDSGDGRVRDCHKSFNGKTFEYAKPPEAWYMTKGGRVYTGRFCNPGEDYQCRCVAIPVFERDRISLPLRDEG